MNLLSKLSSVKIEIRDGIPRTVQKPFFSSVEITYPDQDKKGPEALPVFQDPNVMPSLMKEGWPKICVNPQEDGLTAYLYIEVTDEGVFINGYRYHQRIIPAFEDALAFLAEVS